jgi:NADPH:quinone reductase-like Zn-dependent oxidoreductase
MKYKSVIVTKRGGPEVMQIVENELHEPAAGEVRIKVLATGVGRTDINYRYGLSPFSPKVPYIPGYEIMGMVDAVGTGVNRFTAGNPVAALTGQGGYSEMIYLGQEHLVHVPKSLAPDEVVTLILNYVTAYQMLHRVAKVKTADKILLIGASGGVGSALLELARLAGLKIYGTASANKHNLLKEFGATPIDYRSQDFVEVIHKLEPDGLDFVFDGMGEEYSERGLWVLRRGGKLIGYAPPDGIGTLLAGLGKMIIQNLRPNGKKTEFYGISMLYMHDKRPFMEDLAILFGLLVESKIKPIISAKFPILEAAKANQLLESGTLSGNVVLLSPELL